MRSWSKLRSLDEIQYHHSFQQDIANMAGTSRETVSRVLKLLENKSMISKVGHTLVIPDYTFFKQIFGKSV